MENDFAAIFGLCESEKCAMVNKNAVVYKNEVFDRIKSFGKPLGDISTDQTDYRAKLREAKTEDEKEVLSLFKAGGTTALGNKLKGKEDFKLISFVVIR